MWNTLFFKCNHDISVNPQAPTLLTCPLSRWRWINYHLHGCCFVADLIVKKHGRKSQLSVGFLMKDLFGVLIFLQLLLLIDHDLSTDRDWSLPDAAQSSDAMVFIGVLASPLLTTAPSRECHITPTEQQNKKLYSCNQNGSSSSSSSWGPFEECKPCWMCVIASINVTCKDIFVWEFIELLLKLIRSKSINVVLQCQDLVHDRKTVHKQSIQPEFHL